MRMPRGPIARPAASTIIREMSRTITALFGVVFVAAMAAQGSAESYTIGQQRPTDAPRENLFQFAKSCGGDANDLQNQNIDQIKTCGDKLAASLNDPRAVTIDPIQAMHWNAKRWMILNGHSDRRTIDAVLEATDRVIKEMAEGDEKQELAEASMLAEKIKDRIAFQQCKATTNPQYVAGCYKFNEGRAPLADEAEGIDLNPEQVGIVCGDKKLGGDVVCATTYAHEIAHMLGRTKPDYDPKKVKKEEAFAFYLEFHFLDQVTSYKKNLPRLQGAPRSVTDAIPREEQEKFNMFMDAFDSSVNGAMEDGKRVTYPDTVKKYFEHLWNLLQTNGDHGRIAAFVDSLGYKDKD